MADVPWWEPQMTGQEGRLLEEVLESNFLNDGAVTTRFEAALAERVGVDYVLTTTSGTSALFAALAGLGIGAGDEVIIPDITFIATANAVTWSGATPVLVDVLPDTLNIDPAAVRSAITPRTRAIMPVHISGRAAAMGALGQIADEHGLVIVEDAAEALLSMHQGRCLGTIGRAGCISFSPNKTITSGQGGAIFTNDQDLWQRLKEVKDQGRPARGTGGDDAHISIGYNLKFTNLQAAVGLAQLTALDERVARQRGLYDLYAEHLADVTQIRLPGFNTSAGETPQWVDAVCEDRDGLDRHLAARGMHCRRFWHALHTQAPYRAAAADFPVASDIGPRCLWLPSAFTLTAGDVERVAAAIREYYAA